MNKNNKINIFLALILFSQGTFAADFSQISPLISLTVSIGYLVGITLFITGIFGFKKHAENPQQYTIAYCLGNLTSGILLLLSGFFYGVLKRSTIDTSWSVDNSSALSIDNAATADVGSMANSLLGQYLPEQTISVIVGFVYLVGVIAFLKGIYMLKNMGTGGNSQDGGITKALTHMGGGIVSMNIVQFSCIAGTTFGIPMLCIGG